MKFTTRILASILLGLAWTCPVQAQSVTEKLTSLQTELNQLQRDYIDLQKMLMQSGVSPALSDQLKHLRDLQDKIAVLEKQVSGFSSPNLEPLKLQIQQLQDQLAKLAATTPAASSVTSLQAELNLLQRNYSDLQKLFIQSGVSTGLSAQIKETQDKVTALEKQAAASGAVGIEPLRAQLKQLQDQVAKLAAASPGTPAPSSAPAKASSAEVAALTSTTVSQSLAINVMWTLLCGFLVMFMQCGFALVETGFTRAKNAAHTMAMNIMVYSLGMLGYWMSGFAIQMGGTGATTSVSTVSTLGPEVGQMLNGAVSIELFGKTFQIAGASGFFLPPGMWTGGVFALFLFQMVFMSATVTIPTGAMAERWRFLPFCVYAFVMGAFIYPLYAGWVWGGGWLASLGKNFGLGHGHVDFAGSSVVHLCGGILALIGAYVLGPRVGKYNRDGSSNPIPGHDIPMGVIGTFVLAFGWFGFNAGSTLSGMDVQIGVIAVNTMLASAAGAFTGTITTWLRFSKPDPSFMCNGMLAGLAAITAPCAFVDSWAAVLIGAVAGVLVVYAAYFIDGRLRVDDPAGAVAVHGVNGVWGIVALGLFANGRYGAGWNGVDGGVRGLFYGDAFQLVAQTVGIVSCIVAIGGLGYCLFKMLDMMFGNRATDAQQIEGLDLSEMSSDAYPADTMPVSIPLPPKTVVKL